MSRKSGGGGAGGGESSSSSSMRLEWPSQVLPLPTYRPGQLQAGSKMVVLFNLIFHSVHIGERILVFRSVGVAWVWPSLVLKHCGRGVVWVWLSLVSGTGERVWCGF